MHKFSRGRATHSDRLERWLGKEQVERISRQFGGFYYPVALHGVPGNVHIMPGGDFCGEIKAGSFLSKHDGAATVLKKLRAIAEQKARRANAFGTLLDMLRCGDGRLAIAGGGFLGIDPVPIQKSGGGMNFRVFAQRLPPVTEDRQRMHREDDSLLMLIL